MCRYKITGDKMEDLKHLTTEIDLIKELYFLNYQVEAEIKNPHSHSGLQQLTKIARDLFDINYKKINQLNNLIFDIEDKVMFWSYKNYLLLLAEAKTSIEIYIQHYYPCCFNIKTRSELKLEREIAKILIEKDPIFLEIFNNLAINILNSELYKLAIKQDGGLLSIVPEEYRTLELCQLAIENEAYAINFVPEEVKCNIKIKEA